MRTIFIFNNKVSINVKHVGNFRLFFQGHAIKTIKILTK